MTKITSDKPVARETPVEYRHRPIIVELRGGFMTLRLKGTREAFDLPYDAALEAAMKLRFIQNRSR